MKKITISLLMTLFVMCLHAQTVVAKWTFPTGTTADSIADGGIPANLSKAIKTVGGTSAIDFTKNGFTTKSAQTTQWDNGNGVKYWQVEISTTGYDNLTLSSRQQAGGGNPGPRDFKAQYKVGIAGTWTDIGPDINCANDFTSGVLTNEPMPPDCWNVPSIYIRWIMTTDSSITNVIVLSSGISKIDDIYINGHDIFASVNDHQEMQNLQAFPQPVTDELNVVNSVKINSIKIMDATGKLIYASTSSDSKAIIDVRSFAAGFYILVIEDETKAIVYKKFIKN